MPFLGGRLGLTLGLGALVPSGDLGRILLASVTQFFRDIVEVGAPAVFVLLLGIPPGFVRGGFIAAAALAPLLFEVGHFLGERDEGRGQLVVRCFGNGGGGLVPDGEVDDFLGRNGELLERH